MLSSRLSRVLLGAALLLLALAARSWGLFGTSIWVDDAWSIAAATGHSLDVHLPGMDADESYGSPSDPMPASYFLQYIAPRAGNNVWRVMRDSYATESHPPLFYVLLHLWMSAFGASVDSARAFSLLASLATVMLLFFTARRVAGETAAWIACLLCILAPFQSQLSLQIRMYTLVGLIVLATSALTLEILEDGPAPRRVLALVALGIAGMSLHYYFCLYSFVQGVALLTQKRLWKTAVYVGAAWTATLGATAVYVHYQPSFLAQPWMHTSPWYPPLLLLNAASALSELLWFPGDTVWLAKALMVVVATSLLWIASRRLPQRRAAFLLFWLIGPVALMFFADVVRKSGTVMSPRYMVGSSFALYILLAAGLASLSLLPRIALTAVLALGMLAGQAALREQPVGAIEEGADFQKAAREIQSKWRPGDLIVFYTSYSSAVISLAYYLPPDTPILALVYLPRESPGPVVMPSTLDDMEPRLDRWTARRGRVWVVRSYSELPWNSLLDWLRPRFHVVHAERYGGLYMGEWVR